MSFLIVFVSHAGLGAVVPGGFGVTVFFFLSGYLITTLLRLEYESTAAVSLRSFYLRRVLRILPPFYVVLALSMLLVTTGLLPGELKREPLAALLLHVMNYWSIYHGMDGLPGGTGVYWSLAVEEHFYLVFPALFIVLQRSFAGQGAAQRSVVLGLCGLVLAWRFVLVLVLDAPPDRTYMGSDTRVDSILFGCALAMAGNPMLDPEPPGASKRRRWVVPLALLALVFTFAFRAPWFRETLRYTVKGIALTAIFVAAIREPSWWPFRLLNHPAVRHVGVLSYSLYLLHHVVLFLLEARLPGLGLTPRGVLALALSLAMAQAVYMYVEKPSARLRRRMAHAAATAQAAGAAGAGVAR